MNPLGFKGRDRLVDERKRGYGEGDAVDLVESAPDDVRRQQVPPAPVGAMSMGRRLPPASQPRRTSSARS